MQVMGMTRKNSLVTAREPNGRRQRESQELSPTEVHRIRDASLRGWRDSEWGSELGRLYMTAAVTKPMYEAGKRWTEHAAEYRKSIGVFPVKSASLERGSHGKQADPDSDEGQKQATRERNGAERFFAAHARLVSAGGLAESVVRRICEDDEAPCGFAEHQALRAGLLALVHHYNLAREKT